LAARPLAADAQHSNKRPRVGVLWHAANAEEEGPYFKALVEGFGALGYVDGNNITLHHRFPNETPKLFERMAADLVALKVDVLVSVGNVASPYARDATATIPVVFILVADRSRADWWTVLPVRVPLPMGSLLLRFLPSLESPCRL
jgi:putative tryptophan/tyrosine transport system substrate-binding protein